MFTHNIKKTYNLNLLLVSIFLVFLNVSLFGQAPSNDDKVNATNLSNVDNYCSLNAEFTNEDATTDYTGSSLMHNNVWFKFNAPSSGNTTITMKLDNGLGTLGDGRIILMDDAGTWLNSADAESHSEVVISETGLTPGVDYFITVGSKSSSGNLQGTFTLCLDDEVTFDHKEGAVDLTSLIDSCTANAEYHNLWASTDDTGSSLMHNNVWFKFTAPSTGNTTITMKLDNGLGTLGDGRIILMDDAGTWLNSADAESHSEVVISETGLTPGVDYFLTVGSKSSNGNFRGSFTLCLDDEATFDHKEGAVDLTSLIDSCTTNAQYHNLWASTDDTGSSLMHNNVWFKFTAPSTGNTTITMKLDNGLGTLGDGRIILMDDAGTWLNSADAESHSEVVISETGLTPGVDYFITVGSKSSNGNFRGSFTLCLDDEATFDHKEGAVDLTSIINSCTANQEYDNLLATNDSGLYNNVWFKFTAPSTGAVTVKLNTSSGFGTLQGGIMKVMEDNGNALGLVSGNGEIERSIIGLTSGTVYYITIGGSSAAGAYRGTFTLCIDDQPTFDHKEGAVDLTSIINSCTANQEYDNLFATNDSGLYNNVWFKFTAPSTGAVTVKLNTSSGFGTLQGGIMKVMEDNGNALGLVSGNGELERSIIGLTSGTVYYITIGGSSAAGAYRGTFTLCIDDQPTFDHKEGAVDLTSIINSCTANQEYDNLFATNDSGLYNNVWFKFTAPSTGAVTVKLNASSGFGTLQGGIMKILEDNGNALGLVSGNGEIEIDSVSLTSQTTYYITVGGSSAADVFRGTFTLCIDFEPNVTCESVLWAIASGNWDDPATWSITEGGSASSAIPCDSTVVYIKGFSISHDNQNLAKAKRIEITGVSSSIQTQLRILSGTLEVIERIAVSGLGAKLKSSSNSTVKVVGGS